MQTLAAPNPGDFPVGSLESRAAVRAILEARETQQGGGVLIHLRFVDPKAKTDREIGQKCSCKPPKPGTVAVCWCFA